MRGTCIAAAALLLAGCASTPDLRGLSPAPVDLGRYMGRWYIVGSVPYHFEAGDVGRAVVYEAGDDGEIDDTYEAHAGSFDVPIKTSHGHATVMPGTGNAFWHVQFVWPLHVDSVILYVSPDYQCALVGSPDRAFAWVLSRSSQVDDATYADLLARLRAQGFDAGRLRRVPQRPEDIGQPGYG